jgi:hypothetical protein
MSVTVDRHVVRSGSTVEATFEIDAAYPLSCEATGVDYSPISFTHSGTPSLSTYTYTTKPQTSGQIIEVTCEPSPAIVGLGDTSASARVNVIPVYEEI